MKKSILLLSTAIVFCFLKSEAQNAPAIEWQKSVGGTGDDESSSVQQTSDGGFIVAGESHSNDNDVSGNHGQADFWIVKLDATGNIEWQKPLGGSFSDFASSIQQTTDGGFIVAGYSKSNDGDVTGHHGTTATNDYWVVKLDSVGTIEWEKSLGGTLTDFGTSIQQTADSGFVVAGWSFSNDGDVTGHHGGSSTYDYWIVKLTASGNLTWQKSLGGNANDYANSIQQTTDGGFIVAGASASNDNDVSGNHGSYDFWIVKLDSDGTIVWQKCLGGTGDDQAFSIAQTTDGGFITAGYSTSNNGDVSVNYGSADYWVAKLDSSGNLVWEKSLGGNAYEQANFIGQTADDGYIVAGYTASYGGDVTGFHGAYFWGDYWVVKLDNSGNLVWQKCLGGTDDDVANSVQETTAGGFIVTGWSNSTDGDVTGNHGVADVWVVLLSVPTIIDQAGDLIYSASVFPNPATDLITLQLQSQRKDILFNAVITITDVFGKTMFKKNSSFINGSLNEEIFLDKNFIQGMYLVKVSSGQQHWEKPLMVVK